MVKPFESAGLRGARKAGKKKADALRKAITKNDTTTLRASRLASEKGLGINDIDQIRQELDEVIRVLRLICVILASTRALPKEIVEWLGTTLPKAVKYQNPLGPPR